MIVCHCASVTDSDINQLIRDGACTVSEIVQRSGAGRRCAPCREEIATLLSAQQLIPALAD
jgi:bacterioferritin-associated ferredoxin